MTSIMTRGLTWQQPTSKKRRMNEWLNDWMNVDLVKIWTSPSFDFHHYHRAQFFHSVFLFLFFSLPLFLNFLTFILSLMPSVCLSVWTFRFRFAVRTTALGGDAEFASLLLLLGMDLCGVVLPQRPLVLSAFQQSCVLELLTKTLSGSEAVALVRLVLLVLLKGLILVSLVSSLGS